MRKTTEKVVLVGAKRLEYHPRRGLPTLHPLSGTAMRKTTAKVVFGGREET